MPLQPLVTPKNLGRNVTIWLDTSGSYIIDFSNDLITSHMLRRDKLDDLISIIKAWIFMGTVPEDAKVVR